MTDLRKAIGAILKRLQFVALVVFVFAFSPMVHAQTDTLQYTEETAQDSMVQYLTPMEYAFMMHEETKWMLKINLAYTNAMGSFRNLFSFEHTVGKDFSMGAGFGLGFKKDNLQNSFSYFNTGEISGYVEFRWYYNMKKQIDEKQIKRNLSGNYVSLGVRYSSITRNFRAEFIGESKKELKSENFISIYTKWGAQRRFLKKGYFDFGFNTGAEISLGNSQSAFFLSSFVDAGFGFANDKQKLDYNRLCPVLRCYAYDKFIIKTNLSGLFSIKAGGFGFAATFNPEAIAELKIGSSPFSISGGLKLKLFYSEVKNTDIGKKIPLFQYHIIPTIETRWYYNLNKRILKGKTGNGFSANYMAVGGIYKNNTIRYNFDEQFMYGHFKSNNYITAGAYLLWGIQRTYGKHFFFDANIGFFGGVNKFKINGFSVNKYPIFQPMANLRIGYRFN